MIRNFPSGLEASLQKRFRRLYGDDEAARCLKRVAMLIGRYGIGVENHRGKKTWSHSDAILITYGDMLQRAGEPPLATLRRFAEAHLRGALSSIHILPFFPFSSDDGFSVIHYRNVRRDLGAWSDVQALAKPFDLMFDLVLNHCSRDSGWFQDYVLGIAPARRYFIEMDPRTDLSLVVRPRNLPLLTRVHTRGGERHVWTTFSEDQIDLDFANPDVLFEFLDLLLFYIAMGARLIRLDAIAYLWKKPGTPCIHLPETHEVVKLFREFVDFVAPDVLLITETNVPHGENVSYFGEGDEAHMVYQFSLPPLLLHALLAGDSTHLTRWASGLGAPPQGCTFFNFTASHDGIGVRPLEGILPEKDFLGLLEHVEQRGGTVSKKSNPDGSETPYELNITYFDALRGPDGEDPAVQVARFICSQTVAMTLKGIPAVYFNSLVATPNDHEAVRRTGRARTINRHKWEDEHLARLLSDEKSAPATVLKACLELLRVRARHPAFHPDGSQRILNLGPELFAVERTSPDRSETVVSISNFTAREATVVVDERVPALNGNGSWENLVGPRATGRMLRLAPYGTCWLAAGT